MTALPQHQHLFYQLAWGLCLIMASLLGCTILQPDMASDDTHLPQATSTPTAGPATARPVAVMTPTPLDAATSTPSATPTPKPSATPSPSVTPTATPTLPPTWTPLPTVPPDQRGQTYTRLMADNGGCALPCWWGIELGHSSFEEVVQRYSSLGALITIREFESGRSRITALFIDPQIENGTQVRHTFRAQDNIIIEAEIQVDIQPNYQIEPLLQQLGQPAEIWMWTIPTPREGVLPASLRLYFPEDGVLMAYAVFARRQDEVVQLCFDSQGSTILLLWQPAIWDPDSNKGLLERAMESSELTVEGFYPLEAVSNWDVAQLYTVLRNPEHQECLETPASLWPEP